jgi:hypothetical protein
MAGVTGRQGMLTPPDSTSVYPDLEVGVCPILTVV